MLNRRWFTASPLSSERTNRAFREKSRTQEPDDGKRELCGLTQAAVTAEKESRYRLGIEVCMRRLRKKQKWTEKKKKRSGRSFCKICAQQKGRRRRRHWTDLMCTGTAVAEEKSGERRRKTSIPISADKSCSKRSAVRCCCGRRKGKKMNRWDGGSGDRTACDLHSQIRSEDGAEGMDQEEKRKQKPLLLMRWKVHTLTSTHTHSLPVTGSKVNCCPSKRSRRESNESLGCSH